MLSRIPTRFAVFALVAGMAAFAPGAPARAEMVTYFTTGSFNGSPASPGISPAVLQLNAGGSLNDDVRLTFTGATSTVNAAPTSQAGFGTFSTIGTTATSLQSLAGNTFTLYITQTVPTPTGGSPAAFDASLTGRIRFNQALGAFVEFDDPAVQLVTSAGTLVTYTIFPRTIPLIPPSSNIGAGLGVTVITGSVAAVVPEPSTIAAIIAGLPMIGLAAWRRNRKTQLV